jgi:GPH family glycoside/pentoside/hexuronide:cation symporter
VSLESVPVAVMPAGAAAPHGAKLGVVAKLGYGAGQFVESVPTTLINGFFFFYITNVCGLSGSLTGIATFLALLIDAVADPVIGSLSDNLDTRWGRRLPVMAISLLPVAITTALLYAIPNLSGWSLFGYTLVLLIAFRVSLSGFIIPYMSLGAELSDDYDERSKIVAFRVIFVMLATTAATLLGLGVFLAGPKGLLDRAAYFPFSGSSAVLVLIGGIVTLLMSLRTPPRPALTAPSTHALGPRLLREVLEVFRNRSFRLLFTGVLVFFIGLGVVQTLALDGNTYFWGLDTDQIKVVSLSAVGGMLIGLPIAFALIGRIEKRTIVLAGLLVLCIVDATPNLADIAGFIPPGASLREHILIGVGVFTGIVTTMVAIAFQSAMADAVDDHEDKFGTRREGLYFASLSFGGKAATGLGALVAGFLLDAIHFPSQQIAAGKAAVISHAVWRDLGLIVGPVGIAIALISLVFFWQYRLDRAAHAAIQLRLSEKRK